VTAVLIAAMTLDKVHRLRAELQSQEELFRSFMDHSPAMAWLRDDRSRYVFLNRAYLQRCGLKLEDRIGKRPSDVWPAEVADKFLRNDRAVLDGGQPVTVIEEAPDPDGTVRHWFNVKFPIISGDGRRFVGGMGLDVTAERKAEARLARAQKLESLSLLAAGAAHDFNNYLSVVLGNAALARQGHEADVDLCEHLHDIEAAGQQMAALCQQMLAFAGRGGGEPRRLDVNALIGETLRLMRPLIPRDVAIHYELEPDVGPITADEMQFRQVAMNLVINACEAMAGRRGTVTLATRQLELDAAGCEARSLSGTSARCVEMTVADDGPGMDTMTCQRAFEPFFTTKPHGRGIGLAAVEGIVRAHGGAVAVAAEPGRGCTFTVLWPASL
jgi:PAS domain S-box-containing protein